MCGPEGAKFFLKVLVVLSLGLRYALLTLAIPTSLVRMSLQGERSSYLKTEQCIRYSIDFCQAG
jgi:hypothetical protein